VSISEVDINQFAEMVEFLNHRSDSDEAAYQEGYGYTVEEAITYARGGAPGSTMLGRPDSGDVQDLP
jgi:hypothetical protein